ncbi:MAG: prepilin-type N-terminal cleavage/methylation domain-containing protein [Patescibacteria group bacterium]
MTFPAAQFAGSAGRYRGSTLLELMMYIAIVALVLTAATSFAFEFALTRAKTLALEEAGRNARFAISRIATEVREASDINIGASTFGSNPGTLSIATVVGANDPTVFSVSGTTLNVKQGAGAVLPLTSPKVQVSEFIVTNLSTTGKTKIFRIHLRLISTNPSALQTFDADYTFETTAQVQKADGFSI